MNNNNWLSRAWELMDEMDSLLSGPTWVKPMNTRTGKTAWKERRRLANAPRSVRKRVLKRI